MRTKPAWQPSPRKAFQREDATAEKALLFVPANLQTKEELKAGSLQGIVTLPTEEGLPFVTRMQDT